MWFVFITWIVVAAFCSYVDHRQQRTIALPIFLALSLIAVYFAFRGKRPSRYRFELLNHGARGVRSQMGFEVHIRPNEIEYIEGDRKMLIRNSNEQRLQVFALQLASSIRWEPPFEKEQISEQKRKEIGSAIIAAVGFLQGAEMSRNKKNRG